jgi:hypothetical protein
VGTKRGEVQLEPRETYREDGWVDFARMEGYSDRSR